MIRLLHILNSISEYLGRLVAPLTILMMVLTGAVVIGRYVFNAGMIPVVESVMYLHACVFLLGVPYTLKHDAHVRVDILYQKFTARTRALIDLGGTLFFLLPVAGFTIYSSLDYVALSWRFQEGSPEPGGLPAVFILKTLIPVMAGFLVVQGIAEITRCLLILTGQDTDTEESELG
ncbi:MAG: TRAP transporter small permease subunit [Pseudomonadales bacterium]|nr:TRAP transporter small permease subunit [Pseudomonadales bacterium]